MKYSEFKEIVYADLYRYEYKVSLKIFVRYLLFTPGFKYTFRMRLYKYLSGKRILKSLRLFYVYRLKKITYKYGIQIPMDTNIGKGLLVRHFGGIFINPDSIIGENFTIAQGVTIGINKGKVPIIGDNVTIGAGAKVIGGITIGDNSVIGVNSVVTKDIPKNAVVVGNPMKILCIK